MWVRSGTYPDQVGSIDLDWKTNGFQIESGCDPDPFRKLSGSDSEVIRIISSWSENIQTETEVIQIGSGNDQKDLKWSRLIWKWSGRYPEEIWRNLEMTQNWSRSDPEEIWNNPKVIWIRLDQSQGDPEEIRWSRSNPEQIWINPKVIMKWSRGDPEVIQKWSGSIRKWSGSDLDQPQGDPEVIQMIQKRFCDPEVNQERYGSIWKWSGSDLDQPQGDPEEIQ